MKNKTRFSLGVIVALITLIFSSHLLRAQNNDDLSITNWNLASGSVQSQDVRIYTSSTSPSPGDNYFDAASFTQSVALIKNENTIYVRFSNSGIHPVPDGGVKVTASYATVDPGLTAANLAALDLTTLNWTEIGES